MVAKPAIAPEAVPRVVGLPSLTHSITVHMAIPAIPARWVETKAVAAISLAARALPPLKPNHPNQRRPVPIMVMGRLCGMKLVCPYPLRGPTTRTDAKAATPQVACTTSPPAKSSTPALASHPPLPHTQWHTGLYTRIAQSRLKTTKEGNRNRQNNRICFSLP